MHGLNSLSLRNTHSKKTAKNHTNYEKGVGGRVWGVGNSIHKCRGFDHGGRIYERYAASEIDFFLFFIHKCQGFYHAWVWFFSFPTPHTPFSVSL